MLWMPALLSATALAAEGADPSSSGAPLDARAMEVVQPQAPPPDSGFRYLGLVQTRSSATNIATQNPFYNGQLVGQLGGTNSTVMLEEGPAAMYTELRANNFLSYAPPILDGQVQLNVGFEIDFAFGDLSYGEGGNTGGGFGADQVNLQTRRLNVAVTPNDWLKLTFGQQFVNDGVHDPASAGPQDLFRSGGGLMFFGSEATGVVAHGHHDTSFGTAWRWRAGAFTLSENASALQDDVALLVGDVQWHPANATNIGLHAWHLRDRSGGQGGVFGLGPTSALSELQGGPRLDLREGGEGDAPSVEADLSWLSLDAGYNAALSEGPLGLRALATWNLGRLYVDGLPDVGVSGVLLDAEARFRYAPGQGSVIRIEGLLSTADDADPSRYTGVMTANSYGIVGAVYNTHGCVLLFPDLFSINRAVADSFDVSGAGAGIRAVTGSVGYDPIPDRLTVQLGGGHAQIGSSDRSTSEVNLRVIGEPYLFMNLGVTAAYAVRRGVVDEGPNPFMVYVHGDWLVF